MFRSRPAKARIWALRLFLIAAILCLNGRSSGHGVRASAVAPEPTTHYYYRFASDRFLISKLEIEFDNDGHGAFRVKEQDIEEYENPINLKPKTVAGFAALFDSLNFLKSHDVYQTPKDFSYMGTATIRLQRGDEQREVTFNYTENKTMQELWQR